ncbi:ground-like domain-containing protein [Ditylenchus destructor]|nr:ground-like domain-containing protein [Ditylenchus destructor]
MCIDNSEECGAGAGGGGGASFAAPAASQPSAYDEVPVLQQQVQPQPVPQTELAEATPFRQSDPYPLRECYTDDSNYMCCNNVLESLIKDTYQDLAVEARRRRQLDQTTNDVQTNDGTFLTNRASPDGEPNLQSMADQLQERAEQHFNTTFEVIVGTGDYASKSHFLENYICKVRRNRRFILAYGTPKSEREPTIANGMVGPLHINGFFSSKHRIWLWK